MNIRVVFYKFEYIITISGNQKEPQMRFFFFTKHLFIQIQNRKVINYIV